MDVVCRSCSWFRRRTMIGGALGVLTVKKATCRPTTSKRSSQRSCRKLSSGRWRFPWKWRSRKPESAGSCRRRKRAAWDAHRQVRRIMSLWKYVVLEHFLLTYIQTTSTTAVKYSGQASNFWSMAAWKWAWSVSMQYQLVSQSIRLYFSALKKWQSLFWLTLPVVTKEWKMQRIIRIFTGIAFSMPCKNEAFLISCNFHSLHFQCPSFLCGTFTSKVGQSDLVFGLWSQSVSRSVHARLQVSVCSGYDLCLHSWQTDRQMCIHIDTQTAFWSVYMNSSVSWAIGHHVLA